MFDPKVLKRNLPKDILESDLATIDWLVNGERRSGRTTALAVIFLTTAINKPNEWLPIFDHHPSRHAARNLMDLISTMFDALNTPDEITLQFGNSSHSPRIKVQAPQR